MSINAIINNSLSGLFTNQAALRTTSNNIANLNTPGYARQVVRQETLLSGGVKISEIERIVDRFLVQGSHDANAEFSRFEIESGFHSQIQSLLGSPDENNSLSGRIDQVFNAISEMALNPLSAILKESTISAINQFGSEIGGLIDQIQKMRLDASNKISEKVERINALTLRVEELNPLIIKETVTGGDPAALIENRAQAIAELANIIDIKTIPQANNNVQVTTMSGVSLVGITRNVLQYIPPGIVTSSTPFPQITIHKIDEVTGVLKPSTQTIDSDINSGQLKGLLTIRDKDLPEIALQLGSMAGGFVDELNRVHNLNTAVTVPNVLTGSNTGLLSTDNHNFTGQSVFAITDLNGDLVSKVTVDFGVTGPAIGAVITAVNAALGANGTLALTNGVMTFTAAPGTSGVSISQVAATPSSRAGRGFSHFFGMNDLVESNRPAHFETGVKGPEAHGFTAGGVLALELTNLNGVKLTDFSLTIGGASFDDLLTTLNAGALSAFATFSLSTTGELVATPVTGGQEIKLFVKSDNTTRGATGVAMSAFFGIGDSFHADAAIGVKTKKAIESKTSLLALAQFDQAAIVGANALSVGDQTGAIALRDLQTTVRSYAKAGGLGASTVTLAQYSANLLADLGLRAALVEDIMADKQALSEELTRKNSDVSGVNLDEELGNMIIFQNSYSASARLLNTAKEMFDVILEIV